MGEAQKMRLAERKPLDRKRKHPPRYQREKDFWFSFGTQKRT